MTQLMSRADCLKRYGSDYYTQQHIADGSLYRIDKGVFSEQAYVSDLALMSWKYPNAVITMLSAWYYYGLTDVIPDLCEMATDMSAAKIKDKRVHQYFQPKDFLYVGAVQAEDHGYPIRIYSKERMLVELLRYKNKLPFDLYKEVLLNYRKILPELNMQDIQDIAVVSPKRNMIMQALQLEVL